MREPNLNRASAACIQYLYSSSQQNSQRTGTFTNHAKYTGSMKYTVIISRRVFVLGGG